MQLRGMNLCDFCFAPIEPGQVCAKCGLSHERYRPEAGLLMPGTNLLGKYIIGRVLGRGGFGVTYLAYSSERNGIVAIKEYYPTGIATRAKNEEKVSIVSEEKGKIFEKGAKHFFEEAKTISQFNKNNNVVSVYEFFYANDTAYYTMEYLEGIDLRGYMTKRGGKLSEAEAFTIIRGVCDALLTVHSTMTLHRDISPDNIFVCTTGDVKLIDFGAAKQVIGDDSRKAYSVVVKQGFAPPEQYQRDGHQGTWTDIYAVGASIYYAVTGEIPPDPFSRQENPEIRFNGSLHLSVPFMNMINKCLQIKTEHRYQNALELSNALDELNIQGAAIGGRDYIQTIYSGRPTSSSLQGGSVNFDHGSGVQQSGYHSGVQNNTLYFQPSGYQPSGYQSSQYVQTQYEMSRYADNKKKSGLLQGLIIGIAAVIVVVLLVILVVNLLGGTPPQQPGGNPGGPPPMMP